MAPARRVAPLVPPPGLSGAPPVPQSPHGFFSPPAVKASCPPTKFPRAPPVEKHYQVFRPTAPPPAPPLRVTTKKAQKQQAPVLGALPPARGPARSAPLPGPRGGRSPPRETQKITNPLLAPVAPRGVRRLAFSRGPPPWGGKPGAPPHPRGSFPPPPLGPPGFSPPANGFPPPIRWVCLRHRKSPPPGPPPPRFFSLRRPFPGPFGGAPWGRFHSLPPFFTNPCIESPPHPGSQRKNRISPEPSPPPRKPRPPPLFPRPPVTRSPPPPPPSRELDPWGPPAGAGFSGPAEAARWGDREKNFSRQPPPPPAPGPNGGTTNAVVFFADRPGGRSPSCPFRTSVPPGPQSPPVCCAPPGPPSPPPPAGGFFEFLPNRPPAPPRPRGGLPRAGPGKTSRSPD